jgi:hypothetical protein
MAARLLGQHGVVGKFDIIGDEVKFTTIAPLCGCREVSKGEVRFDDGHVGPAWRWLYAEVDDDTYERLPAATPRPQTQTAGDDKRPMRR